MKKRKVITGLGMIGDFGAGKEDYCNFIEGRKQKQPMDSFNFDDCIDTTLLRRADPVSYFASVAAGLALNDAGLSADKKTDEPYKLGAIIGTVHGALGYTIEYHKGLVLDKPTTVSPSLFSNSVINAAVSCISNIFKVCGYTLTVPGYAGVHQATKLACELIEQGHLDKCLVGGVDINNDFLIKAYSLCMENSSSISANFGGSGFLVVESLDSAVRRNSRIYAEILGIEVICADYRKAIEHKISPLSKFNLEGLNRIFSASFPDRDSRIREEMFLKEAKHAGAPVIDCSNLFGVTFAAAESFQIILGILRVTDSDKKVLINFSSQAGSNAGLLLYKYDN